MVTFLDLLIVVVLVLAAVSLLAVALMFLVKNKKVKRVCLYLAAALGVYLGYVGLRIMWPLETGRSVLAVLAALVAVGAVVLERLSRDSGKKSLAAQIMASAGMLVGLFNAFL